MPTERGLAQMRRSDEVMAAIEGRHAAEVGEEAYAEFKQSFQRITELQRTRDRS